MTDEKEKSPRGPVAAVLAILLVLMLPLLYVLSSGPVALFYEDRQAPAWLHVFYWPLGWLFENSETAASAFEWYFRVLKGDG